MPTTREIPATDAYELRRAVLRFGDESADVAYPEDDVDGAFHLARADGGRVVAVASFSPSPTPYREGADAWQLRGMAVTEDLQRQGAGGSLLDDAIARLRSADADVLWCNARDTATDFYAGRGFVVCGEGFVTATTGLPHHVMVLDL